MTVSRLPSARTKDIILRLSLETSRLLAMASARANVDPETIAERAIEAMFSPDGRTKSERKRIQATESAEQLRKHHKDLGLTNSDGLVQLANSADLDVVAEVVRLSAIANADG